ncbi:MAG: hypothetical protein PHV18_11880 [Lachnospiraceae bacterium]|nr:hypothetical protein [Lachnospiraceae bacterium]
MSEKEAPKKPEPIKNDPYGCDDPDIMDIRAGSCCDCTGLIPALPASDSELESYAEIFPYPADVFHG